MLLVNLSGRGDKDMHTVAERSGSSSSDARRKSREAVRLAAVRLIATTLSSATDVAHRRHFRDAASGKTQGADSLRHRGRSDARPDGAAHARAGGGGRRRDRARRAVFRPDGRRPDIQRSSERALKHGVGLKDVLGFVREFRKTDATTPVVLMGYANPIEAMGYEAFATAAHEAGVDGVLVVDYPPEEAATTVASSGASAASIRSSCCRRRRRKRASRRSRAIAQRLYLLRLAARASPARRISTSTEVAAKLAADPRAHQAADRRRASASAMRRPRRRWRKSPMPW